MWMPVVTRHETNIVELQALLDDLETLPRVGFFNGIYRKANNVVKANIVSRADIVKDCEEILKEHGKLLKQHQMPSKSVTLFTQFFEEVKKTDIKALDKPHYVTGLASKWVLFLPALNSYETANKKIPETGLVRSMIAQLKQHMNTYSKSWSDQFQMAGGV